MPLRGFPALSWAKSDAVQGGFSEGSAVGAPKDAYLASLGEHRERLHFYRLGESAPYKTDYLYHLGDDALTLFAEALIHRCNETHQSRHILEHRFRLLPVWNLVDNSRAYFPEVYFSLNPRHPERGFLPLSDSTGCASHSTITQSVNAALNEFCERQSLLYHWFAGTCRGEYHWPSDIDKLPHPQLWKLFGQMGDLRVFDISLFEGIPVVLCLYRSFSPHPVQFLISTASAVDWAGALQSAIEELWQGYCFMLGYIDSPERVEKSGDRYIRHFVRCNHPRTVEAFAAWQKRNHPIVDYDLSHRATGDSIHCRVEKLQDWSNKVFAYTFQQFTGASSVYYSKVFSTDFFPFMAMDSLPAEIPVLSRHHIYPHRFSLLTPLPFP